MAEAMTDLLPASSGLAGTAAAKPRTLGPDTVAVTGRLGDGTGAVVGVFRVDRFALRGGTLMALGTLSGTATGPVGPVQSGSQQVAWPVDIAQSDGTGELLDLVLGPLELSLLGHEARLDQVHVHIADQQRPAPSTASCWVRRPDWTGRPG